MRAYVIMDHHVSWCFGTRSPHAGSRKLLVRIGVIAFLVPRATSWAMRWRRTPGGAATLVDVVLDGRGFIYADPHRHDVRSR